MKIKDLKNYSKNPRKITGEDFQLLGDSLQEFGDLSGIIYNRTTGEVIGGNQRSTFFKNDAANAEVVLTEEYDKPNSTGTVGLGYIVYKGEKYAFRVVEWDQKTEEKANILANKAGGQWDFDILANQFDTDMLLANGWKEFELGFGKENPLDLEGREQDKDQLNETLDSYLHGSIRQISFHFSVAEYEDMLQRLDKVMEGEGLDNHTDVFIRLVEKYEHEGNRSKKEGA